MTNLIQAAKEQAAQLTRAAYERAAGRGLLPAGCEIDGAVEVPRDGGKGDFASSFAVAGAKALGMAPRQAAGILLEHLELEGTLFQRVEIAGPGYLNFFCASRWYEEVLAATEGLVPAAAADGGLPSPPASLTEVRRQVWEDALASLLRRAGGQALPVQEVGPVRLLREGRPAPGGDWAQAGQDALRYFLTSRPAGRPVELDVDLAVRQDGGNPLYYVQYTYARVCVLAARLAERSVPAGAGPVMPTGEGRALVKALAQYPEEIRLAAGRFDPSRVNRYLAALAGAARRFYQAPGVEAAWQAARVLDCTGAVLADGLDVLGLEPQRPRFAGVGPAGRYFLSRERK